MRLAINFLVIISLMLISLTALAQDTGEPPKPAGAEEVENNTEKPPADTNQLLQHCLLYTSPSPRDAHESRMPSSA